MFYTRMLLFAGLFFTACSPIYYSPNTQNVPLLTERGETNLTLAGNGNRIEFQGAYGITGNMAVAANLARFSPDDLDNGNGGSGKLGELGVGYFRPVGNRFVFEAYGWAGLGGVENHLPSTLADYPQTTGEVSARIFRLALQPNFGFKSRFFSAAVSSRFASVNYSNIDGSLIFLNEDQVEYLRDHRHQVLVEPALTLRAGVGKFKLQLQSGLSLNLSNNNFSQDDGHLTIGLNFNFR